jgi:hypothetical protein
MFPKDFFVPIGVDSVDLKMLAIDKKLKKYQIQRFDKKYDLNTFHEVIQLWW